MAANEFKMNEILTKYDELTASLSDPAVVSDTKRYMELSKELGKLSETVDAINSYKFAKAEEAEALDILSHEDSELYGLANEMLHNAKHTIEIEEQKLVLLLTEKDSRDDRSVIIEIRAGAGGQEAALISSLLLKMYRGYAQLHGFAIETIDYNGTELGGYKEVVFEVKGSGAYSRLKFESGVHRIQRVPVTESGGRVHTSTATVAVLPEADAADVTINQEDLKIDTYRASGAGGQHINKTDSAIRITHIPTGMVVTCQDERSQYKNKDRAMSVLQSRLWEMTRAKEKAATDSERKQQIGTGDRSERIRTYNYHQGRVTDHRIGLTLYRLDEILAGDLDEIIDALTLAAATNRIQHGQASSDDGDDEM